MTFDDALLVEMLRRSYLACDGLWFVNAEETWGLAAAFDLDDAVWEVMPKIQARKARELLGVTGNELEDLARCYSLKLAAEGYRIDLAERDAEIEFTITSCPWRAALQRARRTHLGPEIARRICAAEGLGWAREFGENIAFQLDDTMCEGAGACRFVFRRI
ncbi:MAG: L-2-amino-thiazoline-4-carboxylic acid hydrolase [Armatimonadetes bacterium]|nr:L-2-amino-thiazoline-4-carboxylic acid hydrolase [Armatimonadota bacterium]